jgi:hypothetical protein
MRWVGSRFTGASAVDVEHTVIASSGDLAYTVGFERSHVSVDGGPPRDMVIRVTHIYRRIGGDWKLIHRHADFPLRPPGHLRAINPGDERSLTVTRGHPAPQVRPCDRPGQYRFPS